MTFTEPVLVRVQPEILALMKAGDVEPVVILGIREQEDGTHEMTLMRSEVVRASIHAGAVSDRDALATMLTRLLDVALVDGYGETVRDEAEALLDRVGGQ